MWPAAPCSIQSLPSPSTTFHVTYPLAYQVLATFARPPHPHPPALFQVHRPPWPPTSACSCNCSALVLFIQPLLLFQADSSLLLLLGSLKGLHSVGGSPWPSYTPEPHEVFLHSTCSLLQLHSYLSVCFMLAAWRETGSLIFSSLPTLTALASHPPQDLKHHHPVDDSQAQTHISIPDSSSELKILTSHFLLGCWPRYT